MYSFFYCFSVVGPVIILTAGVIDVVVIVEMCDIANWRLSRPFSPLQRRSRKSSTASIKTKLAGTFDVPFL